ncbi:hypothetical protein [Seonamhaeicola sp.]|uniref:hypothetical protein n=1 Tax=Seonamhaeicola sp. TaxID=1912245 RepID=UPI0026056EFC|nr:hypothetical protein [Seonamhaeicola sp.]
MKKLFVIAAFILFGLCNVQSQNIRQTAVKTKYDNVFYRTPNSKYAPFLVERIVYSTSFKGSKSENIYQVSIYGSVKGEKKQLNYNAGSTDELAYYKKVFTGRYKKINLYEGKYKVGAKTYFDTSIGVEY